MTQLAEDKKSHLSNFAVLQKEVAGNAHGHKWLHELRQRGIGQFDLVGFPTTKMEQWRHTSVRAIAETAFTLATRENAGHAAATAQKYSFEHDAVAELVFINGSYEAQLSKLGKLPAGVKFGRLSQAMELDAALVEAHLAKHADIEKNPFVALNTGFINDGAFLFLPRGSTVEGTIHLLFVNMGGSKPTVSHPRVLIVAEDNVEANIVESYVGDGDVYWTNTVSEFVIGNDCRIDHTRLQQQALTAFHTGTMQVRVGRSSKFISQAADIGGRLVRNDLNVMMAGEHADGTLNGLVLVDGSQHVDNHTLLDHAAPNCPSHELYKHVLAGKGSAVFKGQILVRQNAQKTDSKQTSKSLLLSDDANMNSMPALEIYADDVKCTHGSTTGPVDEDMVFYLRSRGVSLEAARHLLTYAFAADVTRRIKVEPVRRRLEDFLAARQGLPQDLRISDLAAHDEAVL